MAQAAYEARYTGHYVTPWPQLTNDRRWFWYEVVDAVLAEQARQHDRPRARNVKVFTQRRAS